MKKQNQVRQRTSAEAAAQQRENQGNRSCATGGVESNPFKTAGAGVRSPRSNRRKSVGKTPDSASAKLDLVDVALLRALELHAGVCAVSSSAAVLLVGLFGIDAEAELLHRRLQRLQRLGLVRAGAEAHDPAETGFQVLCRGKAYLARVREKGFQGPTPEQLGEVLGLPGTLTACVVKVAKHRRCSVFTLMEVAVFSALKRFGRPISITLLSEAGQKMAALPEGASACG